MSLASRHGRVRVPVLAGLLAATLAQPGAALAQDADPATTAPVASACLLPDVAAAVGTDKPIYGNFETVTLSGSGYAAGCTLKLEVEDPAAQVAAYDVTTDANGAFTATHELADVDGTYVVRVRDAASGEVLATSHFIDGLEVTNLYDGAKSDPARLFDAGDTVLAEGRLDAGKRYRWVVRRPDGTIAQKSDCSTSDSTNNQKVESQFSLPADAAVTGANAWRYELHQYGRTFWPLAAKSAAQNCADETYVTPDLLKFRVAKASSFADLARTTPRTWFKSGERAYVSIAGLSPDDNWTVAWYKPNGGLSCRNVYGNLLSDGLPDVGGNGVLETLAYAPLSSGGAAYNRLGAYWSGLPGDAKCVDTTLEGEWSVEVKGEEWNPHDALFGGGITDTVSKRFTAFGIDATKPTISASDVTGWHASAVAVTLTASDALSGLKSVEWRKAGGSAWTAYDAAAKPTLAHGEKLQFRATDVAGNVTEGETAAAKVDGAAPTTTATGLGAGWQHAAQTITLTATDDGPSGVDTIKYRKVGDSAWTTYDAAAKPALGHGESLELFATDVAGNAEAVKTVGPAQVDGDAPTTTATLAGGWSTTPVEVTLSATDDGPSGVDTIEYRKTGASAWTTYDTAAKPVLAHDETLEFRATDVAGNVETTKTSAAAQVDGDAPTTTATGLGSGWQDAAQQITLTATDSGPSGVDKIEYRKVGASTWETYDAAAKPALADGEALEFHATDVAGNAEAVQTIGPAQVDTNAPTTTATFSTDWSNGPVPVTLAAADDKSGVDKIEVRKVGAPTWATYDAAAKPTLADGEALEFRAIDEVGNTEATKSTATAKVDTEAPATTATLASGWQKAAVSVALAATDTGSGVDKIEVRVSGTPTWTLYVDAARPTLTHGQSLEFRATDEVGNTETTKVTAPAQVDGQAPTTTDDVPTAEVTGPTAVTLTAADAGPSGVAKVEWRKAGTSAWTVYAAATKPVLAAGERLEYRATDVAGNEEAVKQSAALKVKAPVTGSDVNKDAPIVAASSSSRSALLPTVTNLAISPACMVGMTLEAPTAGRKAVTLSYVLGGGATQVEITIQRREPSAARTSCAKTKNVRTPGAKYETVDQQKVAGKDGAATSDIGSHDDAATARAASASKTVKRIVSRRAATAGRNQVTLAKLAAGKSLAPGTYRVLVVAIGAGGERSAAAKAIFRVAKG